MFAVRRPAALALLFALSCVTPAAALPRHPAAPAATQSRAAVELPALGPGGGAGIVFTDALKQASPWTSNATLHTDRLGNVRELAPGQQATAVVYRGEAYPLGDYALLYTGRGTFDVDGGTIVSRDPGRIVVRVTASGAALALRLTSTEANDYVRDLHLVLPGL